METHLEDQSCFFIQKIKKKIPLTLWQESHRLINL